MTYVLVAILLIVVIAGIRLGTRDHQMINDLRPPKSSWRQGHKLRRKSLWELENERRRTAQESVVISKRRRRVRQVFDQTSHLDEADLEEMDGMFGSAGDRPEDY